MIEVKLNIRDEERIVNFPNSYEDLKYREYIYINKILLKDVPDKLKDKEIISYLLNIKVEDINGMYLSTYNELIEQISFLSKEIPVNEEIDRLRLGGKIFYRKDLTRLLVEEQEFIEMIQEQYGIFESIPYLIAVLFTEDGNDRIVDQEYIDKIAKLVEEVSLTKVYNVFFSSSNLKQISTKNIVTYFQNQMKMIEETIIEELEKT